MDNRQQRTLQAFVSIKVFLEDNRLTPAPPLLAAMRKSLQASIDRIRSLEFKKAMKTVTVIEGLVMLNYGDDPATQAVWRRTRRVSARMGRPKQRSNRPQVPAPPPR